MADNDKTIALVAFTGAAVPLGVTVGMTLDAAVAAAVALATVIALILDYYRPRPDGAAA